MKSTFPKALANLCLFLALSFQLQGVDETVTGKLTVDQNSADTTLLVEGGTSGSPLAKFIRDNGTGSALAEIKLGAAANNPEIIFTDYSTAGTWAIGLNNIDNSFEIAQDVDLYGSSKVFFTVEHTGNVGVGTTNPQVKLEVEKPWGTGSSSDIAAFFGGRDANMGRYNTYITGHTLGVAYGNDTDNANFWINWQGYLAGDTRFRDFYVGNGKNQAVFMVDGSENAVGIGTSNPAYRLDVAGTVRAKEIIVESNWADFVFEEDYELMPLEEVADFISEEKRLPGVPTAEEVQTRGASVGETQTMLLQKVEELTLYLIEQDSVIKKHQEEISKLKTKNQELEQYLGTILSQLKEK